MMRCLKGRRSSFGQANLGTPPAGVGSNAFHVLFLKFMKPLITTSLIPIKRLESTLLCTYGGHFHLLFSHYAKIM